MRSPAFEGVEPCKGRRLAARTTKTRSALAVGLEEYRDIRADVKLQPDLYGTEVYHTTTWLEAN
jgi:hypothetical protein